MHRAGADARVARLRRPRRHAWPARAIGPPARVSRRMPRGDGRRPPNRARVSARCPDRARACPPGRASGLSTRRANPKWRLGSQSAGRSLWAGWWLWPFQNSTTRPSGRHDQGRRPSGTARRASTSTVLAQSLPGYPGHALPSRGPNCCYGQSAPSRTGTSWRSSARRHAARPHAAHRRARDCERRDRVDHRQTP
jgi:hypothetical protein